VFCVFAGALTRWAAAGMSVCLLRLTPQHDYDIYRVHCMRERPRFDGPRSKISHFLTMAKLLIDTPQLSKGKRPRSNGK